MQQHPHSSLFSSFFLLLLFFFSKSTSSTTTLSTDIESLLAFRQAADPSGRLSSWNLSLSPTPCSSWLGVSCSPSPSPRVDRLVLNNLSLSAPSPLFFPALLPLDRLRVLSLRSNRLSGPLPPAVSRLHSLRLLFLSRNSFSGPIPPSLASLSRLRRLDLSSNNLSGPIPNSLNNLPHLLTLRLQGNALEGSIARISLPGLKDLNFSSNRLSGAIPSSLAAFPADSFGGNRGLCGFPLSGCSNRSLPAAIVASPSAKPEASSPSLENLKTANRRGGVSRVAVVGIVVGDFALLVSVSGLLFCFLRRRFDRRSPSRLREGEKVVFSSTPYVAAGGGALERGKMVFFDGTRKFELEDLLRSSAEMLGKGGHGTAYKAVLDDGGVVAVKRLRDVQFAGKRDFERHMAILGGLRHPNLVSLKAYYFAGDERLLVYDFMPGGSLHSLLHGKDSIFMV